MGIIRVLREMSVPPKDHFPVQEILSLTRMADMSKHEHKPKLVGPWRNLHGAVWLIGLAILAWRGWWWPGILVLVALSMVLEALLMMVAPQAFEKEAQPASPPPVALPPAPLPPAPQGLEHRLELLPSVCPNCGGPIRGHEVKWTGAQSADCPYCGANLPLGQS
jgi:hypothetical protein